MTTAIAGLLLVFLYLGYCIGWLVHHDCEPKCQQTPWPWVSP